LGQIVWLSFVFLGRARMNFIVVLRELIFFTSEPGIPGFAVVVGRDVPLGINLIIL
jgi:hypothetical protein